MERGAGRPLLRLGFEVTGTLFRRGFARAVAASGSFPRSGIRADSRDATVVFGDVAEEDSERAHD